MGDRCTVYMSFGGKISRAAAMELIAVLDEQDYRPNDDDSKASLVDLHDDFYAHEVNYANTDEIEAVCTEHSIDYRKENDAGGGYGAEIRLCVGGVTKIYSCAEGEPMVPLRRILEVETLVSGLADLIAEARFAAAGLPPLEIEENTGG